MRYRWSVHGRLGLVLREVVVAVLAVAILGVIVLLVTCGPGYVRDSVLQEKDGYHARGIHQGLVMWSQHVGDHYPLPSELDRENATVSVAGDAALKDSTGAMYSILIYNHLTTPNVYYSVAESYGTIRPHEAYAYESPSAAINPARARWDPTFRGTPFDPLPDGSEAAEKIGHASYAHLALAGRGRLRNWTDLADAGTPIVGTRGPEEVSGVWRAKDGAIRSTTLAEGPTGTESLSLRMLGPKNAWWGNIAYNDNHVALEKATHPNDLRYTVFNGGRSSFEPMGTSFGDGLFLDECDKQVLSGGAMKDRRGVNALLGLFSRGPTEVERQEYKEGVEYIKQARWFDGKGE
jgi:hypothetical protein